MKKNRLHKTTLAFSLLMGLGFTAATLNGCNPTAVTNSISITDTSVAMYAGDSLKLNFTLTNEDALVTWETSDKNIATVKRGTITAKAAGKCTITASVENGNSVSVEVTVSDRTITISQTAGEINLDEENKTLQLSATASDSGAITWTSSDPSIASVDNNGLVTGLEVGTVTIIASRGLAQASCEINVIMPSRPSDYYRLTKLTNAECVADPGVWHFHVDGSLNSDYSFVETPLHQSSSLSVTLGNLNLTNKKYFYFRYQPLFEVGTKYTIRYTLEANNAMKVNMADGKNATKSKNLTANTSVSAAYVGEVNASQPFHISISTCQALVDGQATTLQVKDITIEEGDTTSGDDVEPAGKSEHADETEYTLEMMTNANIVNNTGAWYYSCDGTPNVDYTFAETPSYNNGVVTFSFTNMIGNKPYNQLRYQPSLDVGKYYKISFKATLTAAAKLTYGTKVDSQHTNYIDDDVEAGEHNYEFVSQVNSSFPFSINLDPVDRENPASLVLSDITIVETTAPEQPTDPAEPTDPTEPTEPTQPTTPTETTDEGYDLEYANKSKTIENAGTWFFMCEGTEGSDYSFVEGQRPHFANDVATLPLATMTANKAYQLRYQPTFALDSEYTVTFKLNVSAPASVVLGRDGATKTVNPEENVDLDVTYDGNVHASNPFFVQVKPTDYAAPVTMTISEITFTEKQTQEPEDEGYDLVFGNKSTTIANAGTWYFMCEGTEGSDYSFVEGQRPHFGNNTATLPLATMTANKAYQLRYQPTFAIDSEYTVTFKLNVTAACNVILGRDGATKTVTPEAGVELDVDYDGNVHASNPFFVQVKPADYASPITMTISEIAFTAKTAD